jgi:hypothetical protein
VLELKANILDVTSSDLCFSVFLAKITVYKLTCFSIKIYLSSTNMKLGLIEFLCSNKLKCIKFIKSFHPHYGLGVDSAFKINVYQEFSWE